MNGHDFQSTALQACIDHGQMMSLQAVNTLLDEENFQHDWGVGKHIQSKNRDEIVLALNRALLSYYATSRNTGLANQVMSKNMLSALDDDAKKPEENTASSDTHDNTTLRG